MERAPDDAHQVTPEGSARASPRITRRTNSQGELRTVLNRRLRTPVRSILFNAGFSEDVTGFRTTIDRSGSPLAPGERSRLNQTMKTPLTLDLTGHDASGMELVRASRPSKEGGRAATEP